MEKRLFALTMMGVLVASAAFAQEETVDEVVVISSYINQIQSNADDVVRVLSGDEIMRFGTKSIGASLENALGATTGDYGAAVGQPVIRGLSGNRLKILINNVVVRDVAGLGADHINDVDLNNIQQVEIVRGPSSLLYANGSVGGIINIVDNTIARSDFLNNEFKLGLETQSVNDGDVKTGSYQGNINGFNISLGWKKAEFKDYDIPRGAILDDDDDGGDGDGHDDEHEDPDFVANSDYEIKSQKFGISKTGAWGYFGVSFQETDGLYGLPYHPEEEDAHGGGDNDGDGDAHGDDEEGHENERTFATPDSQSFSLEGLYVVNNNWLNDIGYHYRDSAYSLTEQHAEEDGHEEEFTRFANDAKEYGVVFDLASKMVEQKLVVNFVQEDVAVAGGEAAMMPTQSEELTFGYYLGKDLGMFNVDAGVRYDHVERKGSVAATNNTIQHYDLNSDNTSYAISLGSKLDAFTDVKLGFANVERAPSASEYFMNGPHLATRRVEVGDANLESEKSNNTDLTFDYKRGGFFGKISFFSNHIDDYIYLLDGPEIAGELIRAEYMQKDAEFHGYEFEIGQRVNLWHGLLWLSVGRDTISGKFADGTYVPRMPPSRNIYSAVYAQNDWEVSAILKNVAAQSQLSTNETPTDGYEMLDINFTQTFQLRSGVNLELSIFGNNLLDEVARNHTSPVKDEVPLAGKNYGIGLQMKF